MILEDYSEFGGRYGETASVSHVLAHLGLVSPFDNKPFSEALLFGISGGIGLSYFTFEYEGFPPNLYIGVAHRYKTRYGDYMNGLYKRLGLKTSVKTTTSSALADKHLKDSLFKNQPVIVHLEMERCPYYPLLNQCMDHAVVVYGYEEKTDRYLLADRSKVFVSMSADEMSLARSRINSLKNKSTVISLPETDINLEKAVREGLLICIEKMINPPNPVTNFGINGLRKWADLVNNTTDKKGWPRIFKPGPFLYEGLKRAFYCIEILGTGGSALRELYADFIEEAGDILHKNKLKEIAFQYRDTARQWKDVADSLLPDSVPLLKETKELAYRKELIFVEKGEAGLSDMTKIVQREREIKEVMEKDFPLNKDKSMELLDSIKEPLLKLYIAEKENMKALKKIMSLF